MPLLGLHPADFRLQGRDGRILVIAASRQAQSLRCTRSVTTHYQAVTLTLEGPTHQTCRLERLGKIVADFITRS